MKRRMIRSVSPGARLGTGAAPLVPRPERFARFMVAEIGRAVATRLPNAAKPRSDVAAGLHPRSRRRDPASAAQAVLQPSGPRFTVTPRARPKPAGRAPAGWHRFRRPARTAPRALR